MIYSGEVKINLPLNKGIIDKPLIFPSTFLSKYIEDFSSEKNELDIKNAGVCFSDINNEIESL